MSYAAITFRDRNPVKRWLQRQRLVSALAAVGKQTPTPAVICDFGAGNGELCKVLVKHYPQAGIICYEPAADLLAEAKENLRGLPGISFYRSISGLGNGSCDAVFALEVFEHLPPPETQAALQTIYTLLRPKGRLVVGVPVEVGIPAIYKGLFRMARRYGAFDADIRNVLLSFAGNPPRNRPQGEIAPGFNYYFEHVGFDYRGFGRALESCFKRLGITASPFSILGPRLMPEVCFTVEKE